MVKCREITDVHSWPLGTVDWKENLTSKVQILAFVYFNRIASFIFIQQMELIWCDDMMFIWALSGRKTNMFHDITFNWFGKTTSVKWWGLWARELWEQPKLSENPRPKPQHWLGGDWGHWLVVHLQPILTNQCQDQDSGYYLHDMTKLLSCDWISICWMETVRCG